MDSERIFAGEWGQGLFLSISFPGLDVAFGPCSVDKFIIWIG